MRYLFRPVTASYSADCLHEVRQRGDCVTFHESEAVDARIGPDDTWEAILARCPAGWQPDAVVLYLPYTVIPACLWSAPVPLIGLAADSNLLWHYYREALPLCDLVFSDQTSVEKFQAVGISQARYGHLYGGTRTLRELPITDTPRDIDILFVGNLHPAIQAERLSWLARLAALADRWQVQIHTGVFDTAYHQLLQRAKIVFNRGIRGECNHRVSEAIAGGALLFQEANNREVPTFLTEGEHFVSYDAGNLEEKLNYYLEHSEERQRITHQARQQLSALSFAHCWARMIAQVQEELSNLRTRRQIRPPVSSTQALRLRVWQALAAISPALASLPEELRVATAQHSETAWHWHALGVVTSTLAPENAAVAAVPHLRQAIALAREHPLVRLSYAQNLLLAGQPQAAAQEARQLLTHLHQYPPDLAMLQEWHSPATFDEFRVAWERAGWEGAGQPAIERRTKRQLLLWRVQALLAQATGHLAHFYEAVLAHPTAVSARAALGAALGRQEQFALAVPHLQQAQQNCPFDPAISRLLGEALARSQQAAAQQQLVQELRRRARCVPSLPRESWFADTARPATELTSILILCCNEVAYTQQCLESLLQTTVPPYELILVNNGSTDGTAAYLDNVKNRSGPARVVVLHNPTNVGFAAGCNQALAQAQGTYLVLLNNDTILTPGWLEGLLAWTRQEGPPVGLVGPVSNYVPPPQHVTPDYTDPAGLAAFAQGRRRLFAGHAVATERLSGFCLLVRREVFDRIGTLDEQFALGFFEDDDLCVRAREAGFRLLIALDVYIHHYGSRTFSGLGLNSQERLHENFAKFQAKWGSARTAGYRWPEPSKTVATALVTEEPSPVIVPIASLPAEAITLPGVSLTMIVKNEEANLGACLTSAADLVQEVVIVDTGSTDRTKEIAQQFGARVIDFPWIDHFAAARNESLRHARGQWCFWLDADDRLDETNRQRLRHLFATLPAENIGFVMKCLCLPDPQTQATTMVHHVRLFPNRPDVRWQYRVHEQILPALRRANGMVRWSDVVIQHVGYQDPALRRRKLDRDLRLLRLEEREQPDEPFVLFNLGSVCLELGQTADALSYLRRSLTKSAPEDSIVRKLYALLIKAHRQEQQLPRALQVCAEGQYHYPDDPELRFQEAQLRRDLGDFAGAEKCFRQVLATPEGDYFASVDIGLRTYLARHNLGVVLRDQGRGEEAAEHWRQVVAEQPGYGPSLLALAEHYLEQNENGKFAILMDQLAVLPNLAHETELLHNRALLAQGCFRAAQDGFRRLIVQNPHWLPPRLFLSHALLQEGRDWRAAEQALLDILVLAPSHSDARKNLEVLRHLYLSRE